MWCCSATRSSTTSPMSVSGPDVIVQVGEALPSGWSATLAAVDGSITADVKTQLKTMPAGRDSSHRLGRGQQRAPGEKADRGERALGSRSARQARQDQSGLQQELWRHARRGRWRASCRPPSAPSTRHAIRTRPRGRSPAAGLTIFNDIDPAPSVRARAAGDRSAHHVRRRCRLRQRHRAFGQGGCQDRAR